ncbi:RagB/SusD family nutrient uptake outer membrane protein [Pedobacter miscanthi]|nr:RagB/SusD family nutrient uptake outer membrane protein [Pedobacter miscanthi]
MLLLVCTGIVMSFMGCEKYLDIKSDSKLLIPGKLNEIQGILDDVGQMNNGRTPSYAEAVGGDFFLPTIGTLNQSVRDIYVWKKFDYQFPNDWSNGYLPIYNANLSLELLDKLGRNNKNAVEWDNVKGSSLFFRSYYLYLLTAQYGLGFNSATSGNEPGVVIRLSSDFNIRSVRSTVNECLGQAIRDAEEASALLPDIPVVLTRPSKAAAFAQLSRIYLYMRDYENALIYADKCLKIKSELMDFNTDTDVLGLTLNVPFKKFNKETVFYTEMSTGFGLHAPSSARIDTALYNSYLPNDLRKTAYFKANGLYQQFKGSYSSSASVLFSGFATDEIYLNRAESKAWLGDIGGAMDDLNFLLKKRWRVSAPYSPLTSVNKIDALRKIRTERRKELLMRGLRWADLKRYNKEGEEIRLQRVINGVSYFLEPNSLFYAVPLPADIIELTGIPQN